MIKSAFLGLTTIFRVASVYASHMMNKKPELREDPDMPEPIIEGGKNGELVFFVGSGVSMLDGLPSWNKLAAKVLKDLCEEKCLDYWAAGQISQLAPITSARTNLI